MQRMKVLDLHCSQEHRFEGWFASEDEYVRQLTASLVECPMCGSHDIRRLPSAPRLNLGASAPVPAKAVDANMPTPHGGQTGASGAAAATPAQAATMQKLWLDAVRHVMANTEDVGERFAEEARRIHYGEVDERAIRGQATAQERDALREEGIEVTPLPIPASLKGPQQ